LIGGKYRIGSVIGSGGVATVYRATHVWTERQVAVKVLDPGVPHFEHLRDAFLREARATVQLNHPNVVDVLDMGEEDWATAYMVMELLEGPTLRDVLLERERLTETETLAILLPLIDALEKAHELGIVHRDFKPENIMLIEDARGFVVPKLIDFGVAEILQKVRSESLQNQSGIIMGTPQYMSPEQAQDQRARIGPHTDIWGVGVVWYECLTGHPPFDGETSLEILEAVCRAPIDFEPAPDEHAAILADMLTRPTEQRIDSLTTLKARLEGAGIELPSIPAPQQVSSSWAPAGPEQTGVQPTLAGLGPKELLSAPPAPREIQLDSELLNVPFQSQRKVALAGLALALAVVFAAWWTVREPSNEARPLVELELPERVAIENERVEEAEPEGARESETVAAPVREPETAAEAEPDAEMDPAPEPEATKNEVTEPKPKTTTTRRKPKAQPRRAEPQRAAPTPREEPDYKKAPDLVTEW
jgi:serine/threonine protein kinase